MRTEQRVIFARLRILYGLSDRDIKRATRENNVGNFKEANEFYESVLKGEIKIKKTEA